MPLSYLPAFLATTFLHLAHWLDCRSGARLPLVLVGILFARGRRTVTSWFRAAGITTEFSPGYITVHACGRHCDELAWSVLTALQPLIPDSRLVVAIDDTPTPRWGPCIEGAGIHHNPNPGPADDPFVYGLVWVTMAVLAKHPDWGTRALPLQSQLYIRETNLEDLPSDRRVPFRTKLDMAAEQLHWLKIRAGSRFESLWVVFDGAYAKRPLLRAAREEGFVVVSRLPRNASLWSLPKPKPAGRRGPAPTYGRQRISLAKRAGHAQGWQEVRCVQYRREEVKEIKTFLATWRPAGGVIRVVLLREETGWVAFFCTDPSATVEEILETAADRGAIEETFKDLKEVWGAGEQQVRNLDANVGCFNLNGWMYSLVEAWAWERSEEDLVDRSRCPWDDASRRPSHADRRKALQQHMLREEIQALLDEGPSREEIEALTERLVRMAG